ncbi:MAG: hypothetical protein AAEJ52_19705 [Myxococcota bacterium]
MAEFEIPDDLRNDTRAAWNRYVDLLAPIRPDLHRYCRGLTRNLWDAEDLVQEVARVHLHTGNHPRGWQVSRLPGADGSVSVSLLAGCHG